MKPSVIVVVDDSRAVQAIVTRVLKGSPLRDARVHAFSCGHDALAFVSANATDLVITDLHMPGMSGLELLQALRQDSGSRIKVGMVTSETHPDRLDSAKRHGAAFVLGKPFDEQSLLSAVSLALGDPACADPSPPEAAGASGASAATAATAAEVEAGPASKSAVPAPGPCTVTAADVDQLAVLTGGLAEHFGPIRFRLESQTGETPFQPSEKLLLTLLERADGHLAKLVALDHQSTLILEAGARRLTPDQARCLMDSPGDQQQTLDSVNRVLGGLATCIAPDAVKTRSHFVNRTMPKLDAALRQRDRVRIFKLHVPVYGEGRFALISP